MFKKSLSLPVPCFLRHRHLPKGHRPARPVAHPASGCRTALHRRFRARLNTLQATRCRTRRSRPRQARPSTLRAIRRRRVLLGLRNKPHLKRTGSAPGTVSGRFIYLRAASSFPIGMSRSLTRRSSHLLPCATGGHFRKWVRAVTRSALPP